MIKIVKRDQPSRAIFFLTPVLAIFLTLVAGGLIFYILGFKPFEALKFFFIVPIADMYGFSELLLKQKDKPIAIKQSGVAFKSNSLNPYLSAIGTMKKNLRASKGLKPKI